MAFTVKRWAMVEEGSMAAMTFPWVWVGYTWTGKLPMGSDGLHVATKPPKYPVAHGKKSTFWRRLNWCSGVDVGGGGRVESCG